MTTTTNDGTFTIASGGSYVLNGGSFDNAGGSISNGGTLQEESYTFTERGGSQTGNPVTIDSATLDDDTTAGGGQFTFIGSDILTGTGTSPGISTGQTLTIESSNTTLQLAKSLTNDGTLDVGDATTGGLYAQLGMYAAYTLTNDGTLNTVTGSGGVRYLRSNLTNDGTVNISTAKTQSDGGDGVTTTTNDGTFTIASGGSYVCERRLVRRRVDRHADLPHRQRHDVRDGSPLPGRPWRVPPTRCPTVGTCPRSTPSSRSSRMPRTAGASPRSTPDSRPTAATPTSTAWGLVAGSPLVDTTTTLGASSLNPSSYGQSVTFTATVSPTDGGGSCLLQFQRRHRRQLHGRSRSATTPAAGRPPAPHRH